MANSIALFQKYIALLDEVYKLSSLSGDLDGDSTLVRQGANTNEIIIPKLSMDGLADYSRNGGYVRGDVSLEFETVKFNYDRGRQFVVDAMDDEETAGLAFGRLASEFLRTRVVPELDAFRFATYAGVDGISGAQGTLTDGESVLAALLDAVNRMDEDEVPQEQRLLYITPTLHNLIYAIDSYKSKEVLAGFSKTVKVPQTRFYTAIDLKNGTSAGETAGGFMKSPLRYEKCQASAFSSERKEAAEKIDDIFEQIDEKYEDKEDNFVNKVDKFNEKAGTALMESSIGVVDWALNKFDETVTNRNKAFEKLAMDENGNIGKGTLADNTYQEAAKGLTQSNEDLTDAVAAATAAMERLNRFAPLSVPHIPKLATGTIIPPNNPYLAVVGDQRSGTNVEAPLETIVEAMRIALREQGSGRDITVVMEYDGREFGRAVYHANNEETQRVGVRLAKA